ncbi:Uncharacterized protein TCM_010522 [Theobroma cacao]|uniref:Uncharacterized protein n=1 Tax=Theobroma cacao TaxID=3641 RepID=A0A061E8F2_THECC|nr:Uncharacterized protein TCM_010522 [Theobroma cacao]
MKFVVKAWSNGRARAGVLHLGCYPNPIETHSLLISTRKGLPFFISPNLLPFFPSSDSRPLHVSPLTSWKAFRSKQYKKSEGFTSFSVCMNMGLWLYPGIPFNAFWKL